MVLDFPAAHHMPQLRKLWQDAFGDSDAFLDSFFRTAYAPDHCLSVLYADQVAAVLYWIDCEVCHQKLAYIYAVVTDPVHRGKGLCRKLMTAAHELLAARGYDGTLLVPQTENLRKMYTGMGYRNMGGLNLIRCTAADTHVALRSIGPTEFAAIRRTLLPPGSVIQEGPGLLFLAEQLQFYAGDGFLLAAFAEGGTLHGVELLGHTADASGIPAALNCRHGVFRTPGTTPFAMFHPLTEAAITPAYFGFAFD